MVNEWVREHCNLQDSHSSARQTAPASTDTAPSFLLFAALLADSVAAVPRPLAYFDAAFAGLAEVALVFEIGPEAAVVGLAEWWPSQASARAFAVDLVFRTVMTAEVYDGAGLVVVVAVAIGPVPVTAGLAAPAGFVDLVAQPLDFDWREHRLPDPAAEDSVCSARSSA